ncbi:MAG: acyl-CoA dehydrogenase family protein, partial [Paraburkholderia sp.]
MGYVFRTEEQQGAVDGLRRYLADKADPLFNKEYRDRFVPKELMGEFMRELSQFGLISGTVGEEHGGLGLDWLTMIMLFEEVAATSVDLS